MTTISIFWANRLQIYTQICLCYPVADASSHPTIIKTLTHGLERLTASFPWIADQVVIEGAGEGTSGVFRNKPLENIPRLSVRDHQNDPSVPNKDEFRRARFPMSMFDGTKFAPRNTIPGTSGELPQDCDPIFLLQANFIAGGLLLTIMSQHNAMYMVGQGLLMYYLSRACHDGQFTVSELSSGNLPRRHLIPFLPEYKEEPDLALQIVQPPHPVFDIKTSPDLLPPPKCPWATFNFDQASLTALKSLATATILQETFISTDDALASFIFIFIMRERFPRLDPNRKATLTRAVDARGFLGVPGAHLGLMNNIHSTVSRFKSSYRSP